MDCVTSTRQVAGVTIVDISGRIVLGGESAKLRKLVCDLLDRGQKNILFNLADVNYIDSSGLGNMVGSSLRANISETGLVLLINEE